MQGLFAIEALAAAGVNSLPVTPVFFINSDEEVGSRDSTRVIIRLARSADRCFVLEPSLGPGGDLKTARKGVGRFTITVRARLRMPGSIPAKGRARFSSSRTSSRSCSPSTIPKKESPSTSAPSTEASVPM